MRRGFIFTLDAMLMLIPIFIITITVYNAISEAKYLEEEQFATLAREKLCEQTMSVLEKSGVLESIAQAYALNDTERLRNIIENELKPLIPAHLNFSIKIENDTYSSGTSQEFLCSATRVITGYERGRPALGYMSRAYLTKIKGKVEKRVIGWQRVLSPSRFNNVLRINHTFKLPEDFDRTTAADSWLRIVPRTTCTWWWWILGERIKLYVNDEFLGIYYGSLERNDIENYLKPGTNYIYIEVDKGWCSGTVELGTGSGSILYLEYQTSQMFTGYSSKFYLYDVVSEKCPIKYQNSLFVPGRIKNITVQVRVENIRDVYLVYVWGKDVIIIGKKSPDSNGYVIFTDSEIKSALNSSGINYTELSRKVFNLNLYFDVNPQAYEASDWGRICRNKKYRHVFGEPYSYIKIDYEKDVEVGLYTIDLEGILGEDCQRTRCIEKRRPVSYCGEGDYYYADVKWYYHIPNYTRPWYVDIWIAATWSIAPPPDYQAFSDNDYIIYEATSQQEVDKYLIRFAYRRLNEEMMISGQDNYFRAQGDYINGFHGFCPSISYGIFKYLIDAYVPYGQVFPEEGGGYDLIVFYDGNNDGVYTGATTYPQCLWKSPDGCAKIPINGGGNITYVQDLDPDNKSVDDAVLRLLDILNFEYINDANGNNIVNNKYVGGENSDYWDGTVNNPIDIQLTEEMRIDSVSMGGIPELYTPITVTLRIAK